MQLSFPVAAVARVWNSLPRSHCQSSTVALRHISSDAASCDIIIFGHVNRFSCLLTDCGVQKSAELTLSSALTNTSTTSDCQTTSGHIAVDCGELTESQELEKTLLTL